MLIRFSVTNWKSLRDTVTLDMAAGLERRFRDRIARIEPFRLNVLPLALIYGGNASGKTNLIDALRFAKALITSDKGLEDSIGVQPFKLSYASLSSPTTFEFTLLIDGHIYTYAFSVNIFDILSESLVVDSGKGPVPLFTRRGESFTINESVRAEHELLEFAAGSTRKNVLFLKSSLDFNREGYRPVYDWFARTLTVLGPKAHFANLIDYRDPNDRLTRAMNTLLPALDTGISAMQAVDVPVQSLPIRPEELEQLTRKLVPSDAFTMMVDDEELIVIDKHDGRLRASKIVTAHEASDDPPLRFEMREESDGTRRLIQLLPAFIRLVLYKAPCVFAIDELERSLHPHLAESLLDMHLESCSADSRKQLIVTTHDPQLMTSTLVRRDEVWLTERDTEGVTNLLSMAEFENHPPKKRIDLYRKGAFGATPNLHPYLARQLRDAEANG